MNDWQAYTERLEQFFTVNSIANEKTVATLLTIIGKKAYDHLRNFLAPVKPSTKDYDCLVQTMKAHLDPKPLVIMQHFKFFHQRCQKRDESISQFIAELRS